MCYLNAQVHSGTSPHVASTARLPAHIFCRVLKRQKKSMAETRPDTAEYKGVPSSQLHSRDGWHRSVVYVAKKRPGSLTFAQLVSVTTSACASPARPDCCTCAIHQGCALRCTQNARGVNRRSSKMKSTDHILRRAKNTTRRLLACSESKCMPSFRNAQDWWKRWPKCGSNLG